MSTPPPDLVELLETGNFAPQRAFKFRRDSWVKWLGHIDGMPEFLASLPDTLDRKATAEVVYDRLTGAPEQAFAAAMIWGFGGTGYGPYRTAYILTGSRNLQGADLARNSVEKLVAAAQCSRDHGPTKGYYELNNRPGKVAGLGPAFFTKWLHFVTKAEGENAGGTAPILDQLIIKWLKAEAGFWLRPARTSEYERYLHLLQRWGQPYGLVAADVEERIFRLIRHDE